MRTTNRVLAATIASVATVGALLSTALPAHAADANEAAKVSGAVSRATVGLTAEGSGVVGSGAEALTATSGHTRVSVPRDSGDGIALTTASGASVTLGLPTDPSAAEARRTSAGTVVYPATHASSDVAVQVLTDGSVRALVTLADASAPHEYRFPVRFEAGGRLVKASDGGVIVVADNEASGVPKLLGRIAAPWAKDARGNAVPTSYRIEGDTVVQTVEHGEDTAFPVVADPTWGWSWWPVGPAAYLDKGETNRVADGALDTGIVLSALLTANPAMLAAAKLQANNIRDWARVARDHGKCEKLIFEGIIFGEEYSGGNCK